MNDGSRWPGRFGSCEVGPAVALLEFTTVPDGIVAGDAVAKRTPLQLLRAGTVHPGHYLVLLAGTTAEIDEALDAALQVSATPPATVVLNNIDPQVIDALSGTRRTATDALAIIETTTVTAAIDAADAAVKAAEVVLRELRLADGLGGKGYLLLGGALTDLQAAVEHACERITTHHHHSPTSRIITRLDPRMDRELTADARFHARLHTTDPEEP